MYDVHFLSETTEAEKFDMVLELISGLFSLTYYDCGSCISECAKDRANNRGTVKESIPILLNLFLLSYLSPLTILIVKSYHCVCVCIL